MTTNYITMVKNLVDEIKAICAHAGLGGDANEYKIVTQSFLYKFLNDKFLYEVQQINPNLKDYKDFKSLDANQYKKLLEFEIGDKSIHLKPEHLLSYLFSRQDDDEFASLFDDTLNAIAIDNNDVFSVHTDGNTDIRLFEQSLVGNSIADGSKRNNVAKDIINRLANYKFDEEIFTEGFDFFSTIFEYMISDYNKDGGGKYAEYYTPHSIAKVMAEILVGDEDISNAKIYDPSAGSGTLLMNIASKIGADKCTIYSQDISQKSSNLLRLNLILNNLAHSINNIVQGNTIIANRHPEKMDFVVSNPPFKMDFADWRNQVESLPNATERFFAGVPTIPPKKKDSMAIYLLFIQHIMYSLSARGRAAIVVPTGFITAATGIEKKIREKMVKEKILKGVVSMPADIFANTGTNVSILFLDKGNKKDEVVLVDASNLGSKEKIDGKNEKTVLSKEEEQQIIDIFHQNETVEDLSIVVSYEDIKDKNYSFSAGQYFPIKIEYVDITAEQFDSQIAEHKKKLKEYFKESEELEEEILNQLDKLGYEERQ